MSIIIITSRINTTHIFKVRRCEVMAKFIKVLGVTMRFALAGVLIVGHLIMSYVGILVTAITSQD